MFTLYVGVPILRIYVYARVFVITEVFYLRIWVSIIIMVVQSYLHSKVVLQTSSSNNIYWTYFAGKIRLIPSVGTIFGGTAVRVVGPCVQDPQDIKCSFGKQLVEAFYLEDERQFLCVTPEFEEQDAGRVPFTLSFTQDGETVRLKSSFYKSE